MSWQVLGAGPQRGAAGFEGELANYPSLPGIRPHAAGSVLPWAAAMASGGVPPLPLWLPQPVHPPSDHQCPSDDVNQNGKEASGPRAHNDDMGTPAGGTCSFLSFVLPGSFLQSGNSLV